MKNFDVVILTDDRYVEDSSSDAYYQNVYLEDDLVKKALERLGLKVDRKSWSDPNFDWSSTRSILFRSTWDYFDRFAEFSNWLIKVSKVTQLLNSADLIRWNIDKHYLLDLQKAGVHICETYFVEAGTHITLKELHKKHNLDNFVLKPCISGAARHTYKIHPQEIDQYETIFQELIAQEAMMLQPFQHNIVAKGEVSLMVMNGNYTHGVLKIAKEGDFRVQDDYGGSVHNYQATPEEIAYAENAVKSCPEMPIYARVDVFLDNQNRLALAELELIEPELWFRNHPEAADELAKGIAELLYT
jgi:glutathione synthase/RimK-type ligase-like ATP-grasp enzyme